MEQNDRDRIDFYCNTVLPKINIVQLWPKLLEHKIYNRDDVNIPQWTKDLASPSTIKEIFLTIKTRGPKAFKNLLLSLRQSGHSNVADILEDKNFDSKEVYNYLLGHDVQRSNEPLKIELRKATEFLDGPVYDIVPRYPMRSNPRGLVLIITNIHYNKRPPRLSAEHDESNLTNLFQQMGFKVFTERDLSGKKIKEVVKNFSKKDELKHVDSCFVIISSHGTEDEKSRTEIQGVDYEGNYEKVLCADILDYFTAEACPHLAEKPKIFIFQLCRGSKEQNSVVHSRLCTDSHVFKESDKSDEFYSDDTMISNHLATRNYADMLVVQSTLPGHVSYRDSINGSWFIQIFCKVFMNLAHMIHLQDLFTIVDVNLKNQKTIGTGQSQTSCVKSIGFNKHCYLNPGLFEKT